MYEFIRVANGKAHGLKLFYYMMNNIFREIINLNGGYFCVIHKFEKNLLARMAPGGGSLSINHFMWIGLSNALDDARSSLAMFLTSSS